MSSWKYEKSEHKNTVWQHVTVGLPLNKTEAMLICSDNIGIAEKEHGLRQIIKYLAIVSGTHIDDSVGLLATIFDLHGANWYFKDDSVKCILGNAANASRKTKSTACVIVHKLGESGKDWARLYLDRLRQ